MAPVALSGKKRYGLKISNYMVISNDIHLLVADDGGHDVIPKSMQLIAGWTGQEFNQRKNRNGAFWEDRYHATTIEDGDHFFRCCAYIDLNMVRVGVVDHPAQWPHSGYNERTLQYSEGYCTKPVLAVLKSG